MVTTVAFWCMYFFWCWYMLKLATQIPHFFSQICHSVMRLPISINTLLSLEQPHTYIYIPYILYWMCRIGNRTPFCMTLYLDFSCPWSPVVYLLWFSFVCMSHIVLSCCLYAFTRLFHAWFGLLKLLFFISHQIF